MVAKTLIETWVRPSVRELHSYHVPDSSGMIKLDAMESPYSLQDDIKKSWLEILSRTDVNRYPDADSRELKIQIRRNLGIPEECKLILGNGSDELIQLIAILLGGKNRVFISPTPSFSMYQQISLATNTEFVGVPLNSDFSLNFETLLDAIRHHQPACIFLAYPNNPTGNCFSDAQITEIISEAPGMVVLDEAYNAFCGKSWLDEVEKHPNLVVLRTLSKSGLAGLRLGILAAGEHWAEQLEKLRLPYNINVLTQVSGRHLLEHYDVMVRQSQQIIDARRILYEALKIIPGITVYPSETNFLLMHTALGADFVHGELKKLNILVKNLNGSNDALKDHLRITVSCESENEAFLNAIKAVHVC